MKKKFCFVYRATTIMALIVCAASLVGCPSGINERFTVDIQRHYETTQERDLILVAENTYPSREDVAELYPEGTNPLDLPENVWWYFGIFGNEFRLPYAITTDTIEYYKHKVREDGINHFLDGSARWYPEAGESLYYSATIEYFTAYDAEDETFSNVYVVTMVLSWGTYYGPGTGSGVGQDRVVVLTPSGEVLQVQGDGPAVTAVS